MSRKILKSLYIQPYNLVEVLRQKFNLDRGRQLSESPRKYYNPW
jgi:hypothetical protein